MDDLNDYCTIAAAAEQVGDHYTTDWIRKLCKRKQIVCMKLPGGRDWLVKLSSLTAYIASNPRPGPRTD